MGEGFTRYLTYTRSLHFTERPDYQMMHMIMTRMRKEHFPQLVDHDLDWLQGKELSEDLIPVLGWEDLPQPDDVPDEGKASTGCFSCRLRSRKSARYAEDRADRGSQVLSGGTE